MFTMAFRLVFCVLVVYEATMIAEVSAMNNSTILLTPSSTIASTPNTTIFPTSTLALSNQSSSTTNQSSANISISPTSIIVQPSPSQSVGDSAQVNVGDSKGGMDSADVPLPPDSERRDFELIANTNMKWVRYLLDKQGAEYIFMNKYIRDIFIKLYKDVAGFIKTELMDFFEEKVTFKLLIYTRKEAKVAKSKLESLLNAYMKSGQDTLKIYAYEFKPRFQEMTGGGNIKADYGPAVEVAVPPVDGFIAFLTGFGVMFAMVVICTVICIAKYKVCQKLKSKDNQDKESLTTQEAPAN